MTSEAKDDLIARLEPVAKRAVAALRTQLGWTALADHLSEYIAAASSLTEQVERLTMERDALLQGVRDADAIMTATVFRLRAENEKMREALARIEREDTRAVYRALETAPRGAVIGPMGEIARDTLASLSNTSEGGKDE